MRGLRVYDLNAVFYVSPEWTGHECVCGTGEGAGAGGGRF